MWVTWSLVVYMNLQQDISICDSLRGAGVGEAVVDAAV